LTAFSFGLMDLLHEVHDGGLTVGDNLLKPLSGVVYITIAGRGAPEK